MADKENEDKQQFPYETQPLDKENQPELKDEQNQVLTDGAMPQNSEGIAAGQFDALDPVGNANIKFDQGNYQTVMGLPKITADKTAQLVQTFVPLIEVALIELLGSNSMYRRTLGQCQPAFDNQGKISIEFTFQYTIDQWIGMDIPLEAIQHDANYILEKVKPCKANITKCEISVADGLFTIQGTI